MKSFRKVLVALGLVITSGVAAQPADKKDAPAPKADQAKDDKPKADAMPTGEALTAKLDELDKQAKDDARQVNRLRLMAKKAKDVVKLNCVNDKLVDIKGLLNVIDLDRSKVDSEISSDGRASAYSSLVTNTASVRALREEAQACVGEGLDSAGDNTLDVNGPDLPDDPTAEPEDFFESGGIEAPAFSTPFT